jgi:hypothetical protein
MADEQLTINVQHVVHETIDGETIIIHLGSGTYYSIDGVGAEVWALIDRGVASATIVSAAQARYDADPDLVAPDVVTFLEQLVQEGLVVAGALTTTPSTTQPEQGITVGAYVAPMLHKYTDMQEFMIVDPLHDVEEDAGWPHVKAG